MRFKKDNDDDLKPSYLLFRGNKRLSRTLAYTQTLQIPYMPSQDHH